MNPGQSDYMTQKDSSFFNTVVCSCTAIWKVIKKLILNQILAWAAIKIDWMDGLNNKN